MWLCFIKHGNDILSSYSWDMDLTLGSEEMKCKMKHTKQILDWS